jgi:[acyl-carrier-protein] S-malonyltransferase
LAHVASVAGRRIARSRLEERLVTFRNGPGGRHVPPERDAGDSLTLRRWLLQELVTEAVLAHEARAAGLTVVETADHGGGRALDGRVLRALFELVTAAVTVPDDQVRAYYARNVDRYRTPEARRIWHMVVADEREARELRARTAAGEADRARGVDIELRRGELAGSLEDAIFGAEIDEVVGPIQSEHGWHVARVDAVTHAGTTPYEDVRDDIEAELLAAARARVFAEWLEERRRELVTFERGWEHPADPIHGLSAHRH